MAARYRSKTLATWLALLTGVVGGHRFYLYGWRDAWAWLHLLPTAVGLWGVQRAQAVGQDDQLAWLLMPALGVMIAQAALFAILHGLTPDERWDARFNPAQAGRASGWGAVLGVIAALMVGATALMSTIAYSGQRYFEWQLEQTERIKP